MERKLQRYIRLLFLRDKKMKKSVRFFAQIIAVVSFFFSSQVSASLILETYGSGVATPTSIGGYAMTDFTALGGASLTSSVASPVSGTVNFVDKNGNALLLNQGPVSDAVDGNNVSWWNNGESTDYDIYTTGQNWITMHT